jgi:hypothetical protein
MSCFARSCCSAALLLVATSDLCLAQSFESGIKVGASAARLPALELHEGPGGAEIDAEFRVGLVAGAFVAFNITGRWAIQPEVLFSRKGTRLKGHTEDPLPVEASVTLDYVEMPVLARLSIPTRGPRAAYLLAGPALGFSVATSYRLEIGGQSRDEDISREIANTEVSFVVGGGVQLGHVLVEGRYTQGLTRIRKQFPGQEAARNGVVSFMAGFRF